MFDDKSSAFSVSRKERPVVVEESWKELSCQSETHPPELLFTIVSLEYQSSLTRNLRYNGRRGYH